MTNLIGVNTTLSEQVDDYSNQLSSKDTNIAALTKTTEKLQGKASNLKLNNQAPSKKNPYHTTGKKVYNHPNWWSASYCWTHGV